MRPLILAGLGFAVATAIAIELVIIIVAPPRCDEHSVAGPTIGHVFLIAGCPEHRREKP